MCNRLRKVKVLIVEDEWLIVGMIESIIAPAGFDVVGKCGSVEKAIGAIAAGEAEIVILDTVLRGRSSAPIARLLCSKGIPYVVVSGSAQNHLDDFDNCKPFVAKPIRADALLSALQTVRS